MEESSNLTNSVIDTINSIFSNVFSSVDNTIYDILDKITFIDKDVIEDDSFKKLFGSSSSNGILLICNALILGIIIFYALNYLFSHITYSKVQSPLEFIFKAIIFVGVMNGSLWICSQIINIVSLISESICYVGKNLFNEEVSFANFISKINNKVYISSNNVNIASFDGIIKSFATMGFMNLIFSYSLRYIMVKIFVLVAPFAFLCLINNKTEWFFKSWIKVFLELLIEQILVALILALAFSFKLSDSNIIEKLLYVGIIYALTKANTFMYMIFGGISTSIGNGVSTIIQRNN